VDEFHRPTPAASRTTWPVGSQLDFGTRTVIWRRVMSTLADGGVAPTGRPVAASSSSAVDP
jgi:hypothetical protein